MSLAKYTNELSQVSRLLKAARAMIADEVTVQKLDTLLQACLHPDGIEQGTLLEKAKLSRSATSKNVADLSKITSRKTPGPDLLESVIDPMNRVIRTIRVTPNGEREVLRALEAAFGPK